MHIDVTTAVAREVRMAFLWESAGVHPAELEHMAHAALENAVRLFDTTWGLPFAAFARPHVYVALMAIARQRRVAHSLSLWLFKAAAPWPAWRDTKVAASLAVRTGPCCYGDSGLCLLHVATPR